VALLRKTANLPLPRLMALARAGFEILYTPPEPGQEYRHKDVLDSLWNMLDLTPEGRGDFRPQLAYK
jgi:predicted dithiol-disulfide oxidoreductase (DUF899 family)